MLNCPGAIAISKNAFSGISVVASALTCQRGERELFRDLSFKVFAGHGLLLTGSNGSGKSSLLRILAGLLRPVSGSVQISGFEKEAGQSGSIHYLGHKDGLRDALTAVENLSFQSVLLRSRASGDRMAEIKAALQSLDILQLGHLPVGVLSAGQRRRVALAGLLVVNRSIWLLDEPTTALDAVSRESVARLFQSHIARGGILVAATHFSLGIEAEELSLGVPTKAASVQGIMA